MSGAPQDSRYSEGEEIARGGMGVILRVRDRDLDRTLAMKRMLAAPDIGGGEVEVDRFARFMEEAHVTAQLDHPAIVPVHDLGTDDDGCAWYTMKMVRGRELREVIRLADSDGEDWNLPRLVGVLVRVCQAVAYAHGKGVVHRDLKPANIMVGDLGEVYVMDWGLAKQLGREDVHDIRLRIGDALAKTGMETIVTPRSASSSGTPEGASFDAPLMTMDGAVIGTPAYMPPEQAAGIVDQVDHLSDIYALGAILYEMLSAQSPYMDSTGKTRPSEVLTALSNGPPTPVKRIRPEAPSELTAICEKAMARAREDRYESCLDLAEDLQAFLDGRVVKAYQTGAFAELKKWVQRNKATAVASLLVLLSLVALAVLQTLSNRTISASLQKEETARKETQLVLADSYVSLGLIEADNQEFARARLFFNEAVKLSASDPAAALANRMRAKTFGNLAFTPLRSVELPVAQWIDSHRHPTEPIVAFEALQGERVTWVVNLDTAQFLGCEATLNGGFAGVGFDPSSPRFASSSEPGKVDIRRLEDGEILKSLDFSDEIGRIENFCWSRDGGLLFIGAEAARICDIASGELWPDLLDHDYRNNEHGKPNAKHVLRSTFSPSARYLVTSGRFNHWTLKLFAVDRKTRRVTTLNKGFVPGHSGMHPPEFIGDERWLVGSTQNNINVFDTRSGEMIRRFRPGTEPPEDLPDIVKAAFGARPALRENVTSKKNALPDGEHYTSTYPSIIGHFHEGWERALPAYPGNVMCFLDSAREPLVVTRHIEFVTLWRMPADDRLWTLPAAGHSRPVFSPSGAFVCAVGPEQREIVVADTRTKTTSGRKFVPGGIIHSADFTPDDSQLVCAVEEKNRVIVLDWRAAKPEGAAVPFESPPLAVRMHPGGAWYAVGCLSGDVFRVDLATGEKARLIHPEKPHPVDRLLFADGALVATCGRSKVNSYTYVWDIAERRLRFPPIAHKLHGFRKEIDYRDGVLITPNGPHVFCDIATGEAIASPLTNWINNDIVRFGNDPETVVFFGKTTGARIVNWRTGEPVCADLLHGFDDARWSHCTTMIPGTPWVVVSGLNGARFFDIASGKPVAPPVHWKKWPNIWLHHHCEISPNRRTLAFNNDEPGMHMIDLSTLLGEAPDDTDQEIDELSAGAWLTENGLSEFHFNDKWLKRQRAYLEAHRSDPRLQVD